MINTEHSSNGVPSGVTAIPSHDKQLPNAPKNTALRDVQNENVGSIHKQQESLLPGGGKSNGDTIKVCGTKRLTPERPSGSHSLPSLAYNGTNENVMNARRRFELELGKGRLHSNVEKFSELKNVRGQLRQEITQKSTHKRDSNVHHIPMTTSNNPTASPPVPSSFNKHGNITAAVKVTNDAKVTSDQLRTERFIRLQKFLKQCDEANQSEYSQMLLLLSPSELSKRAVELEKRAIQLTIEEGNEMQRMKALNILARSSPTNNLLQSTQLLQSNKR